MTSGWTTVAVYSSGETAAIVKGMLENNGIPVVMTNETISSVYPMTDTWTPIELKVPSSMASEAMELLKLHGDMK